MQGITLLLILSARLNKSRRHRFAVLDVREYALETFCIEKGASSAVQYSAKNFGTEKIRILVFQSVEKSITFIFLTPQRAKNGRNLKRVSESASRDVQAAGAFECYGVAYFAVFRAPIPEARPRALVRTRKNALIGVTLFPFDQNVFRVVNENLRYLSHATNLFYFSQILFLKQFFETNF